MTSDHKFTVKTSITFKEWKFVWWISFAMICLTSFPYFLGYLLTPPGTLYSGLHALSPGDVPIYYSYIRQVMTGNILLQNLFTTESQVHGVFNIWWTIVGLGARWLKVSWVFIFQISRVLLIPIFISVAYLFISYLFFSYRQRRWALIFLLFSSGIGAYLAPILELFTQRGELNWPIDLWLTEAITFTALYQSSHFILSLLMMLGIALFIYLGLNSLHWGYAWLAGLLSLIYFNFHPYYLPVIYGLAIIYFFYLTFKQQKISWRRVGWLVLFFGLSLPMAIYHIWLIGVDLVIYQRALQNVSPLPPWYYVLLGYGFLCLGPLYSLGYRFYKKQMKEIYIFMFLWLLLILSLMILPTPFSRRYTQGLHFVLVFFTVDALVLLYHKLSTRGFMKLVVTNNFLFVILFVLFFTMSNFFHLVRDIYYYIIQPPATNQIFYLEQGLINGYKWLAQKSPASIVLAADLPSRFTPSYSGQLVYVAHAHETLFYYSKISLLNWFYAVNDKYLDESKHTFLKKAGIDFVIYSPYESILGQYNPQEKDYLRSVFTSGQTTIYEVLP